MSARFFIRTFGCQMNEHDSEEMAGLLVASGMEPAATPEDADVVVVNTCCIRENADNKLYGHLGHLKALKQQRPSMTIAIGGCLAQREGAALAERAHHVDVVFGTHNLSRLPALLDAARSGRSGQLIEVVDPEAPASTPGGGGVHVPASAGLSSSSPVALGSAVRRKPHSAYVTIQRGCNNSCTFCTVPQVRGPEVSRPVDEILTEVRGLAEDGVSEVTLLGQNVNSYGRDLTGRRPLFAELLRRVGAVDGILRVRFTSPHPKDLRPEVIDAMASTPAVCEQLHLPLQSGSDRVLARMRRGYTAARFLEKLAAARAAIPDLAVTTDIIVGFPGETDDDADRTLEVVAEAGFDSAYTFIFSPRPGTRASEMQDEFVPDEVVAHRFEQLARVVERSALMRHSARVGREEEVLVEGPSKRDPSMLTGRTRQGKLVHFEASATAWPIGSYGVVRIQAATPHYLKGEPLHLLRAPRNAVNGTREPVSQAV